MDSGFRQFVVQSCDRQSETVQCQKEFWKSYLDVSAVLVPKGIGTSDTSKRVEVFEPGNSVENVALMAQRNGVSVDAILLAAFPKVYRGVLDIEN